MIGRATTEGKRRVRMTLALVVAAVGLVAGAAYLLREPSDEGVAASAGTLVPALAGAADRVSLIEISSGTGVVALAKDGDRWVVRSADGYPADFARIAPLVQAIASLEKDEPLTAKPERHAELGLAWPDSSGRAKLVRLRAGDEPPIEVVLGDARGTPPTTYARLLAENQTWRCKGTAAPEANPVRYMNPEIVALPADEVRAVRHLGLVVTRQADPANPTQPATWVSAVAAGPIESDFWPDAAQTLARNTLPSWLARLEFDGVRRRGATWTPEPGLTIEYDVDGSTVVVEGMREGEAVWVRLRAVPRGDAAAGIERWTTWNASVEPWEYKLPAWKASALTRLREQPKPPAAPRP
ncbi:MAG: DUF4340 domain-containing protein [Phycisphaerae bacterium]|nr:DUF4340 domain-containing protein [Phycisphaerae bacterium]